MLQAGEENSPVWLGYSVGNDVVGFGILCSTRVRLHNKLGGWTYNQSLGRHEMVQVVARDKGVVLERAIWEMLI